MKENQAKVTFENWKGHKAIVTLTQEDEELSVSTSFEPSISKDEKGLFAQAYVMFIERLTD